MMSLKDNIKRIPIISSCAKWVYYLLLEPFQRFPGSGDYWQNRYRQGGVSEEGSVGILAQYKANIINQFITDNAIASVIEVGCGDGDQLALLNCAEYTGVDISEQVLESCRNRFKNDPSKSFMRLAELGDRQSDLALSLDVVYHLVEDEVFHAHMQQLTVSASQFLIVYSSNTDKQQLIQGKHIRHRKFTDWLEKHASNWKLDEHIPNKYPYRGNDSTGSFADFYIFRKATNSL